MVRESRQLGLSYLREFCGVMLLILTRVKSSCSVVTIPGGGAVSAGVLLDGALVQAGLSL